MKNAPSPQNLDSNQTNIKTVADASNQLKLQVPNALQSQPRIVGLIEAGANRTSQNFPNYFWTDCYSFEGMSQMSVPEQLHRQTVPLAHLLINPPGFYQMGFIQPNYYPVFPLQVTILKLQTKDQETQTPPLNLTIECQCKQQPLLDSQEPFLPISSGNLSVDPDSHHPLPISINSGLKSPEFNNESNKNGFRLTQRTRTKKLVLLNSIVQKLFTQNEISEMEFNGLSKFEKQLLYYLVKRKYIPKYLKGVEPEEVTCNYNKIVSMVSSVFPRRPEECYKFILTRVLKHLRKKVEVDYETSDPEAKLYEILFKKISEETGIPMADFHYPLSGNSKGKFQFNFVYFSKVFRSARFLREIERYCQNDVFDEYFKELVKKVNALFSKWEKMLIIEDQFPEITQQLIIKYVIHNKRCKLPWTKVDVVHAINRVSKLVKMCAPQFLDIQNSYWG